VTIRPVDIEKDLEKLADMWNASDDQWPGTWSGGVPITPQYMRNELERSGALEVTVWDEGDVIAGWCSVWKDTEEPDVAYVALLNVPPEHQGKSIGRKLLNHWVERSRELGFRRLDLHTWAGNLKAVPLYKKTGFFWMPEPESAGTHMLNFVPGIMSMPLLAPFFEKHNWYESLRRELNQEEDDERWNDMKVFSYRFEADGESIAVWVDRLSRKITALETNEFSVASLAPDLEPARGLPAPLQWQLENKSDKPIQVSLVAIGSEYLKTDYQKTLELKPKEEATLETKVEVDASIPESKVEKGKPLPAVKSVLVIDGRLVELSTGFRPRPAVEIHTHPATVWLPAGKESHFHVQLRSRMKQDIEARVSVAAAPGLTTDWTDKTISMKAEETAGIPITLKTDRAGSFDLPISASVSVEDQQVQIEPKPRHAFSVEPGGLLAERSDRQLRIENDAIRVTVGEGSGVAITDRTTGIELGTEFGYPGPPSAPSEYWSATFDLRLEREPGAVVAVATYASKREPGFVLEKRVRVTPSPVVEISYEFQNLGPHRRDLQINQSVNARSSRMVTLPLAAGLARGPGGDFPGPSDADAKKPSSFAERWVAFEGRASSLGVIWPEDVIEISWEQGFYLLGRMLECLPQSRVSPQPVLIGAFKGDWRGVRTWWQSVQGIDARDEVPPETAQPVAVRTEPPLLAAADGEVRGKLIVEHFRSRPLSGSGHLRLPKGWSSNVDEFELEGLNVHQRKEIDLQLKTTTEPGGATASVEVRSPDLDQDFELPLVRLGDGGNVKVRATTSDGQSLLTVDNGLIEFDASPGFGGTISSLREGGVDHLLSAFPSPRTFVVLSPWYGGITPMAYASSGFPGRLYKEKFEAEPVTSKDAAGIEWSGVQMSAALTEDEDLRGLRFEYETLTTGGSPIVKVVTRVRNPTSAFRHCEFGWGAFVQPDGSREASVLHSEDQAVKPTMRFVQLRPQHSIAAQNSKTGRTLIATSPRPNVFGLNWSSEGGYLGLLEEREVPPEGSIDLVCYLALAPDLETARKLIPLAKLDPA
jgi:GNAT superfamily N-acetyltransferase